MPRFFPEGNVALPSDDAQRSLSKICDLLGGGGGAGGGVGALAPEVFSGNGSPVGVVTPTTSTAIYFEVDNGYAQWVWNSGAWH